MPFGGKTQAFEASQPGKSPAHWESCSGHCKVIIPLQEMCSFLSGQGKGEVCAVVRINSAPAAQAASCSLKPSLPTLLWHQAGWSKSQKCCLQGMGWHIPKPCCIHTSPSQHTQAGQGRAGLLILTKLATFNTALE